MRKLAPALLVLVALLVQPALAQITLNYPTFTAGTVIDPDQVNDNFSQLSTKGLNRTGGTVTGALASAGASLTGSWAGSPTFSGTPVFTNVPTFSAGLGAISGTTLTLSSTADFNGGVAQEAKLQNYRETLATPSISAGAVTLDLSTANVFRTSLSANVTSLTISNTPATGTVYSFTWVLDITAARTVSWPASVKWGNVGAPTLSSTNGKVDIYTFVTTDGGTNWYGFIGGQNF